MKGPTLYSKRTRAITIRIPKHKKDKELSSKRQKEVQTYLWNEITSKAIRTPPGQPEGDYRRKSSSPAERADRSPDSQEESGGVKIRGKKAQFKGKR